MTGGIMDSIASLSMAMSQVNLQQRAGFAVMDMALDSAAEGMTKMLEMSINPHIGGNIDISL